MPWEEHHALGASLAPVLAAAREHGESPKAVLKARLCRVLYPRCSAVSVLWVPVPHHSVRLWG